jgi:DNA-binding NtrC family response regulator
VPLLARRFAEELGGAGAVVPDALIEAWELERFPGNVRELRNRVARYLALGDLAREPPGGGQSIASRVPDRDPFADALGGDLPWADAKQRVLDAFEGRYVRHLLERHDGNVTRAASAAGIARRYFHRLKARHAGADDGDEAE